MGPELNHRKTKLKNNRGHVITSTYSNRFSYIDDHILYCEKQHNYSKKIYHETHASDWFLAYAVLPENRVCLRSADTILKLDGPIFIFQPAFSLLEFHIEEGFLKWECIGSHLPFDFLPTSPKLLKTSNFTLPKNKQDLIEVSKKLFLQPSIIQERTPSAIAEKLKNYIDSNFREDLKIGIIAKKLNYSREVMTRAFKKVYGISPIEYRHKLRLSEALIQMRLGFSITDALLSVGFMDPSQFIVQFKNLFNSLPHKYKFQNEK
ncbi:MAG: AraC family transcriptional regulator [Bdellovibrionaceae bacterium]|nr:AraC family transcriptional regulator [Pseudobdellovibrionaceae bacterium]